MLHECTGDSHTVFKSYGAVEIGEKDELWVRLHGGKVCWSHVDHEQLLSSVTQELNYW